MASSQDPIPVTPKVEPPLETMSRSFIDIKPGIIKYDVKHTQVITIGNFEQKMVEEPGTTLMPEVFSIKIGEEIVYWFIGIFPNGHGHSDFDGSIGHIGVYLVKDIDTKFPIDASWMFSLVDKNGSKRKSQIFEMTFPKPAKASYLARLISHLELRENPDLIPDDTLTIMCELTIKGGGVSLVDSGPRSSILVQSGNEETSIWNHILDMGKILRDEKFPDVTIVCQGEEFPCHKAILAGRSSVFEAMFSHNMKEKMENKVVVEDIDADTLDGLLCFIYCGSTTSGKSAKLLVAAEKYNLMDLKKLCEENLCVNITVENVLDRLELADLHNAAILRSMALKFIGRNAKEVAAQKDWRERIPDVMADIFEAIIQKED